MNKLLIISIFSIFLYGCNNDIEFKGKSIAPREIEINGIRVPMEQSAHDEVMKKNYSLTEFTIGGVGQSEWVGKMISAENKPSDGTKYPPTETFHFVFDTDKFDTVLSALKTKYPEITCNDDKSNGIRSAATPKTICKLSGKSSELIISSIHGSDGKPISSVFMMIKTDDVKFKEAISGFEWIFKILTLTTASFISYMIWLIWTEHFSKEGISKRTARKAKQKETKAREKETRDALRKALEVKSKAEKIEKMTVALEVSEKSKKRITERIKTNITAGEIEKAIALEFKTISQDFDVNSLTLEEIDENISKDFKVKVIEVNVTRVEDDFLISVKYKPDHFSEDSDIKNDERGFWIIQSILSLGFWIYYGIFYAFVVLVAGLVSRAIKNSAFPHKLKSREIEAQIERCLKNLKNEYSIS